MSRFAETLGTSRSGGTRLAVRMARRMAVASLGRSVLITVLIALPVMGVSAIAVVQASHEVTASDQVGFELGRTQARLQIVAAPSDSMIQDPVDPNSVSFGESSADAVPPSSPAPFLPEGTRLLAVQYTQVTAKTATGLATLDAVQGDEWDASLAGVYDVVSGTRPTSPDEIMVSPAALERFGIDVGGTITVRKPHAATFTVTGTLKGSEDTDDRVILYGASGAFDRATGPDAVSQTSFYTPDLPLSWSAVKDLNHQGIVVLSREVLLDPPPAEEGVPNADSGGGDSLLVVFVALLGAFGLFEVCLLAGAAFAVGARRRQRALALFASVGADRRTIFTMMSVEGLFLGLLGGLLGTGLGLAAAAIVEPIVANGDGSQFPAFRVDVPVLGLIVLAAVVAGWAAAAVPARAASRVDVAGALRGSQRPAAPSVRRPLVGVFIAAAGLVIALAGGLVVLANNALEMPSNSVATLGIVLLVAGPVVMQLGALLTTPLLLRLLATVLSRLGAGARLGGRDASRNSARTVPAVAAIMSCVFVAAFSLCMLAGGQAQVIRDYSWSTPLHMASVSLITWPANADEPSLASADGVAAALDRSFEGSHARVLRGAPDFNSLGSDTTSYMVPRLASEKGISSYFLQSTSGTAHFETGGVADLEAMLGKPASPQSKATLSSGGAVVLYPQYLEGGRVTIDTVSSATDDEGNPKTVLRSQSLPATVQRAEHDGSLGVFVSDATAAKIGMPVHDLAVVSQLPAAPSAAEQDAANASVPQNLSVYVETGPDRFAGAWSWALLAATTLIAVVSAAVALALSRADARRDDQVLAAIGAPPSLQRAFGFWQGVVVAGLGSVIGVALGLVPAAALSVGTKSAPALLPFVPPWPFLAAVAVGIPLLIACGSWLAMRRPRGLWTVRRLPAV